MRQILLKAHPNNPTRLVLCSREDNNPQTDEKLLLCYEEQFTRPLTVEGPDPDPPLILSIKIASNNFTGFASWGDAAAFLSDIEDADAYALTFGYQLNSLL